MKEEMLKHIYSALSVLKILIKACKHRSCPAGRAGASLMPGSLEQKKGMK